MISATIFHLRFTIPKNVIFIFCSVEKNMRQTLKTLHCVTHFLIHVHIIWHLQETQQICH